MFRNHIKIAFRNVFRNKVNSIINIVGLAIGIAAYLFLLQYITIEKSVNQFHTDISSTYRIMNEGPDGKTWPQVEPGWAPLIKQRVPEVQDYCRFEEGVCQGIVTTDGNATSYREKAIGYAEGNFFDFFTFPLVAGNAKSFNASQVVFISKSTSQKYFGTQDALGKVLTLNNQFGVMPFTIKGVYEDMKDNSDIRYDMLFSLETIKNPANLNENSWAELGNLNSQYIYTYLKLSNTQNIVTTQNKLTALRTELKPDKDGVKFKLQPLANIHLGTSLNDTFQTTGNLKYIYLLTGISMLILVIAWFNYINLATANAIKRAGEIGVRKVIGASRFNIIYQFVIESLLLNGLGFLLAIVLVLLFQPVFNTIINRSLSIQSITSGTAWISGLAILISGAFISGFYPAFTLSKYNPVDTIKGKIKSTTKGLLLRKSLVVSQFTISTVLIIATFIIYMQLHYMQSEALGVNTQQLIVISGPDAGKDSTFKNRSIGFEAQLAQQNFIKAFCFSGSVPSGWYNFTTGGFTQPGSKKGDELKSYSFAIIGDKFLNTYEIKLKAGRNFTPQECNVSWNANSKVMVNETALKQLGFSNAEEALSTKIQWDERELEIIGIVSDYHHTSLQNAIDPIIFYPQNNSAHITVRLTPDNFPKKIAQIESLFKAAFPGNPFEYSFVDDNYNKSYISETQYGNIFTAASLCAIFIACLGLFGLATFTVESRVKEIGIRKVLGASVNNIVTLLSKDFMILVLVALIIATPIGYYLMNKWLKDFAYRIEIPAWIFIVAGMLALLVAALTISYQSIRAAIANPALSIRTD